MKRYLPLSLIVLVTALAACGTIPSQLEAPMGLQLSATGADVQVCREGGSATAQVTFVAQGAPVDETLVSLDAAHVFDGTAWTSSDQITVTIPPQSAWTHRGHDDRNTYAFTVPVTLTAVGTVQPASLRLDLAPRIAAGHEERHGLKARDAAFTVDVTFVTCSSQDPAGDGTDAGGNDNGGGTGTVGDNTGDNTGDDGNAGGTGGDDSTNGNAGGTNGDDGNGNAGDQGQNGDEGQNGGNDENGGNVTEPGANDPVVPAVGDATLQLLPPIRADGTRTFGPGVAVPVKFEAGAWGTDLASELVLTLYPQEGDPIVVGPETSVNGLGWAYDADAGTYVFVLDTRDVPAGSYDAWVTAPENATVLAQGHFSMQ